MPKAADRAYPGSQGVATLEAVMGGMLILLLLHLFALEFQQQRDQHEQRMEATRSMAPKAGEEP